MKDEKKIEEKETKQKYEPPEVISFSMSQLLEETGPAQAPTADPACTISPHGMYVVREAGLKRAH
jgi:hypothetical protein